MSLMRGWLERARSLFRKGRVERELDEEMRYHLEREAEKLIRSGLDPAEARRRAFQRFGGVERTKERVRDERGTRPLEDLMQDVRYGASSLLRARGFTFVVVLTLGLGIGANTAIFSLIHGVLLKPIPYGEGEQLVYLTQPELQGPQDNLFFSVHDIRDVRERTRTLERVAEYHGMSFTLLGRGEAEEVATGVVSAHFFDLMGIEPLLGRDFTEADDAPGAEPVLILSHGYWQRRFGADPEVVGQAFEMNGRMHTVIGVLPPVPQYPDENDVYMPTSACPIRSSDDFKENRNARMMSVFGRARRDAALSAVQRELQGVSGQLAAEFPDAYSEERGQSLAATPLEEVLVREARPVFLILLGTAGLVLLIACANVANLALARFSRRGHDLAVRAALGAGRGRLVRQLLTESVLLGVAGGAVGLAVAWAGHDLLVDFASRFTPRAAEAGLSLPVLFFALGASVLTGLLFGAAPALSAARDMAGKLRRRDTIGRSHRRLQGSLVVAQVALAFILLIGSGLLLRSFWMLQTLDPGFDPENVLSMRVVVNTRNSTMDDRQRREFYFGILERIEALPGVVSSAVTNDQPLAGFDSSLGIRTEGTTETDPAAMPQATPRTASGDYFRTVGVPLLAGRTFGPQDDEEAVRVAVVNETFARQVWPDRNAVGQRFMACGLSGGCPGGEDAESATFTVVGIVGDYRATSIEDEPPAQFFQAATQVGFPGQQVVVRTRGEPLASADRFTDVVRTLDPTIPVEDVTTLARVRSEALAPRRLTTLLIALFAVVALAVSLAGIAGVVAFHVSRQTREIGIRMALGARRETVLSMILGQGMRLVVLGLAVGLVGALLLRDSVAGLLWGIESTDWVTWVAVALTLSAVAAGACLIPARRAVAVEPTRALRDAG